MSRRSFFRSPARRAALRRQKAPYRRALRFETLEDRRVLATYTWIDAADTLVINLEDGESVTVSEIAGDVSFALSSGTFTQAGGDMATGDGTDAITIAATALVSSIEITNTGAGAGTNNVTFDVGSFASDELSVSLLESGTSGAIVVQSNLTSTGDGGLLFEARDDIRVDGGTIIITGSGHTTLRSLGDLDLQGSASRAAQAHRPAKAAR